MGRYNPAGNADIQIVYRFAPDAGDPYEIRVMLDSRTLLSRVESPQDNWPEWTTTSFQRCTHCHLPPEATHCPAAVRLVHPIAFFADRISYEPVVVQVETAERFYSKRVDMQQGLSSLFGLLMATSGCPSLAIFRPMARYHLPFATFEETFFRIYGSYLMLQHLKGAFPQSQQALVDGLSAIYEAVASVNEGIMNRLRKGHSKLADSSPNAVALLAAFSSLVPLTVEEQMEYIRALFKDASTFPVS